jgi:hypothetical protein
VKKAPSHSYACSELEHGFALSTVSLHGRPLSLVPRTVISYPKPKIDRNRPVGVYPTHWFQITT